MSSLPGRTFKGSNHAQMGSNVFTNQNQGGGESKAGFPYQVGRSSWSSIAFDTCDAVNGTKMRCGSLKCMQFTGNKKKANPSRPIGSTYVPNTYFTIPGTR